MIWAIGRKEIDREITLMPTHISPLDGTYISLKRAAPLIARDQPGVEPDEIMDLFKHAFFALQTPELCHVDPKS